jgi:hypothetical protein
MGQNEIYSIAKETSKGDHHFHYHFLQIGGVSTLPDRGRSDNRSSFLKELHSERLSWESIRSKSGFRAMVVIRARSLATWLLWLNVPVTASSSSSNSNFHSIVSNLSTASSSSTSNSFPYFDAQGQCPPERHEWYNFNLYFGIRKEVTALRQEDLGNGPLSRFISNLSVRPLTRISNAGGGDEDETILMYGNSNLVLHFVPTGVTAHPLNLHMNDEAIGTTTGNSTYTRRRNRPRRRQQQKNIQAEEGWTLAASYLLERGKTTLSLNHTFAASPTVEGSDIDSTSTSPLTSSNLQPITMLSNNAIWFCEVVEFHFSPTEASGDESSASVTMYDFMIAPYFQPASGWDSPQPSCELPVVPACTDPKELCHAVNGLYECVERPATNDPTAMTATELATVLSKLQIGTTATNSSSNITTSQLVQYQPPIAGMGRDEYLEKYHCVQYDSPVTTTDAQRRRSFLHWVAGGSFLQASNSHLFIEQQDGSSITTYNFQDQFNREPTLYSGSIGNVLERAEQWTENDQERRIVFYFDPTDSTTSTTDIAVNSIGVETAKASGWTMTKLWVYNDQYDPDDEETLTRAADWVYANMQGLDISVPSPDSIFYCQLVEFDLDFFDRSFYTDDSNDDGASFTQMDSKDSQYAGQFTMEHVYLMALQDSNLVENTVCELGKIYNPCDQHTDAGYPYCHAVNGKVSCLDGLGGMVLEQEQQEKVAPTEDGTTHSQQGETSSPVTRAFAPLTSLEGADLMSDKLFCEKPFSESSTSGTSTLSPHNLPNVTLNWQTSASYLFASHVNVVYPANGGTAVNFQDQLGRDTCVSPAATANDAAAEEDGSKLGRNSFWWEGSVERHLSFEFDAYSPEDEFSIGWSLLSTKVFQNDFKPAFLSELFSRDFENNKGIIGAPENVLFYCQYVEFEYRNHISGDVEAAFTGWDFVLGSYMKDLPNSANNDICNWPVYNPCLKESLTTAPVCRFEMGSVSCHADTDETAFGIPSGVAVSRSDSLGDELWPTLGSLGVGPCRPFPLVVDAGKTSTSPDDQSFASSTTGESLNVSFSATLTIVITIASLSISLF